MNEPDVTLTDYALTLECFIFCVLLFRQYGFKTLCMWFIIFFAAIGFASFAGGTVHGFFYEDGTFLHDVFWLTSLVSMGIMALSCWIIGVSLLEVSEKTMLVTKRLLSFGFVVYVGYLLLISQDFLVAILNYLPGVIFLLGVFIYAYFKTKATPILLGIVAIILTFLSSFIQQAQIILHPVYFDHNALYHLIQIVSLFLLFSSAKYFINNAHKTNVTST